MIDRAGSNPAVTSNDLDKSDDEDEDDKEDNDAHDGKKETAGKATSAKASSVCSKSPAGSLSVINSETKEMFSLVTSSLADCMKLMTEQHVEVMAIDNRKLKLQEDRANSIDWAAKREEVSHKHELHKKHNQMKADGNTDKFILPVLPRAKQVIDTMAKTKKTASPRWSTANKS